VLKHAETLNLQQLLSLDRMGKVDAESFAPAWRRENKSKMKDVALFQNQDGTSDGVLWYWVSDERKVCIGLYNDMKNEKLIVTFNGAKEEAVAKPDEESKATFRCKVDGEKIAFTLLPGEMVLAFDGEGNVPGFVPESAPLCAADYESFAEVLGAKVYDESLEKVKALIAERGIDAADDMAVLQACMETGTRFVDLNFHRDHVMGGEHGEPCPGVFLCPEQFLKGKEKKLFLPDETGDKVSPGDVGQGLLGDCWLMAAIAALAEWPERVYSIFGVDGNLQYGNEVGGYVVNHTKDGIWKRTVVDDFLIVRGVSPMFARNRRNAAELWVPILEKAWAKVHGGYKFLQSGKAANALSDLTGSPSNIFMFNPEDPSDVIFSGFVKNEFWSRDDLGKEMTGWDNSHFAMNLQCPGADMSSYDKKNKGFFGLDQKYQKLGLIPGHGYTLYGVAEVNGEILCKIRNPWGNAKEWKGKWSDGSEEWESVDADKKAELLSGASTSDGMFWMSLVDVSKYFAGGSVTMIQDSGTCDDMRFIGQSSGQPSFAVLLKNNTPSNSFSFMASQPDKRGNVASPGPGGPGGPVSYSGIQIRLLVKTAEGWRMAQKEDLDGQAPASRWLMSRDMGISLKLPEGEYLVTLVTDSNEIVVISIQAPKGSDYSAEAFAAPAEARWLQKEVSDASFEIDTSLAAEGVQLQKDKVPV